MDAFDMAAEIGALRARVDSLDEWRGEHVIDHAPKASVIEDEIADIEVTAEVAETIAEGAFSIANEADESAEVAESVAVAAAEIAVEAEETAEDAEDIAIDVAEETVENVVEVDEEDAPTEDEVEVEVEVEDEDESPRTHRRNGGRRNRYYGRR